MRILASFLFAWLIWSQVVPAWAAITYVGGQTGSFPGTAGSTDITIALTGGSNATPLSGDFGIVTHCMSATADIALEIKSNDDTAYTLAGTESYISDLYDVNSRTAYRVQPGTPDTVVRFAGTPSQIANANVYMIHFFRGVHATPLEQAVQQSTALNTSVVDPGGITPTTAGTIIYVSGCGALATTRQGVYTSSDLTAFLSSAQDDTNAANGGAGYFTWTSGAFNPATFGGGGTDNVEHSHSWMIVALAPAATVSTCNGGTLLLGVGGGC